MKNILGYLTFLIFFFFGQSAMSQGIKFEKELGWEGAKAKAKLQNKYIFVDCYTSWCKPCLQMETMVYLNPTVGSYFNDKFISIKLKFDNDVDNIKDKDAASLNKVYAINAYPTFLFFTPEGNLIYRDLGFKDSSSFLSIANFALQPERKKYYMEMENYQKGLKDYTHIESLIQITRDIIGNKALADSIAKDYKENYLDKLTDDSLLTKKYLEFIKQNYQLVDTKDRCFELLFSKSVFVDSILNEKGLALRLVKYYITKYEIEDKLWVNGKPITLQPGWDNIEFEISRKYGRDLSNKLVSKYQLLFYKRIGDWNEFAHLRDNKIKATPPKGNLGIFDENGTWQLNGDAWAVFLHCTDKNVLSKALLWVDLAIKLDAPHKEIQFLDTKANLLYKLERIDEAIKQEEEAIQISLTNAQQDHHGERAAFIDELSTTLAKMKKGVPTW